MEKTEIPNKISDFEKFDVSKQLKADGNEFYKAKKYKQATGKYHRALLYLKGIGQQSVTDIFLPNGADSSNLPEDFMDDVRALTVDCYNNLSACLLQVEEPNYDKIITYCDHVLQAQPNNIKAAYRKGLSLYNKRCFDQAMDILTHAANMAQGSKDPQIRKYMQMCKKELIKQEEDLKETYKGMFNMKERKQNTDSNS